MSQSVEEIKSWLTCALSSEDVSDLSVKLVGSSEKGDGYMGEILFVEASTPVRKVYHLALKCSKKSVALRKALPVKAAFENEIHFYSRIIPSFMRFQRKKGASDVFDSVPKYYGSYTSKDREIVVLENLKTNGYFLSDRKSPLSTDLLKLVLKEYGKWHAVSAAMQDQEPGEFKQLAQEVRNLWQMFAEKVNIEAFFASPIQEIYELIRADIPPATAEKLKNFKSQVPYIVNKLINKSSHFSVITHEDCWNNNFMFKVDEVNGTQKVAFLDWQITYFSNPVMDVSYFIYACASAEDLNNFEELLKWYYDSFAEHMRELGSDPSVYPFSQLLKDFRVFGKYGVMMTILAIKVAVSDKEEAPDFVEHSKGNFAETFSFRNQDQDLLRERMLNIIRHAATQDIL